jgi:hypothetical protein
MTSAETRGKMLNENLFERLSSLIKDALIASRQRKPRRDVENILSTMDFIITAEKIKIEKE